jgi:hypothetical protein
MALCSARFAAIFSVINQIAYRISLSPAYSTLALTYIYHSAWWMVKREEVCGSKENRKNARIKETSFVKQGGVDGLSYIFQCVRKLALQRPQM